VFSSQHAPSRFLYLAVLVCCLAFAAWAGRPFEANWHRLRWLDAALLVAVFFVAKDIAQVGRKSTDHVFYMAFPAELRPKDSFQQVKGPSQNYSPPDAWAGPVVLAMMDNEGFVGCYSVPDRAEPHGAIASGEPGYVGEAYLADGPGRARVVSFSTNSAIVEYEGALAGSTLVYNMNFDPSWRANGAPAKEHAHAVSTTVSSAAGRVTFRYYPRTLNAALLVFAATLAGIAGGPRLVRGRLRRRSSG
jgi:hypothetical protein